MSLARAWEAARGLPPEINRLLCEADTDPQLLLAIPEHKVALPGASRGASQNDLFALVRTATKTIAMTVEGKVDESFDRTLGEWLTGASPGKQARLAFLCRVLGLEETPPPAVHYQLLHRTASALIEAERFKTDCAAMIVHSFSPTRRWFDAYAAFAALFGIQAEPDRLHRIETSARPLFLGWATGDQRFRQALVPPPAPADANAPQP